jgi:hypothetical protein
MKNFKQGLYQPRHPEKYIGDPTKIRYMSSYELQTHTFFDNNPNVIAWSSETVVIPYIKPTDGKVHRYMVDYYVKYVNTRGEVVEELIEVKPLQQTKRSRSRKAASKLYEDVTYAVNLAKWDAATRFAASRGWKFRIITERSIFR